MVIHPRIEPTMLDAVTHLYFDVRKSFKEFSPGLEVNRLSDWPRQVQTV